LPMVGRDQFPQGIHDASADRLSGYIGCFRGRRY
jgi:hypothetical protein